MPPVPPVAPARRLSDDLTEVLLVSGGNHVSVIKLLRTVRGRGFPSVLVILALPFILPVPLPGLSTPIGIVIGLFGLRMSLGKRPLIPRSLLRRQVSPRAIHVLVTRGVPIIRRAERWLHPRLLFLPRWALFRSVTGLALASCGVALALPLPIPFSNTIPAVGTLLLAAGTMEDDGLFILMGYAMALGAWLYLGALLWAGELSVSHFLQGRHFWP